MLELDFTGLENSKIQSLTLQLNNFNIFPDIFQFFTKNRSIQKVVLSWRLITNDILKKITMFLELLESSEVKTYFTTLIFYLSDPNKEILNLASQIEMKRRCILYFKINFAQKRNYF